MTRSDPGAAVHEPTKACATVHCHWHNVDEPGPGYLGCFECGHLFRTKGELRRAYRRCVRAIRSPGQGRLSFLWRWVFVPRASRIWFCPECAHDF